MDLFERICNSEDPTSKMARQLHGYFTYPKLEGPLGAHMRFRGKEIVNWNVNDYLGFSKNPEIRQFDEEMVRKWGLSYPAGNRIMAGNTNIHEELESILADWVEKEDAFLLNYGYQGFSSIVDALCDRNDIIVYDSQIHASMIDGIRLHRGDRISYQHNDIDHLEHQLKKTESSILKNGKGSILLLTQGIFSATGEYGKLNDILALKKKFHFRLLVNDADGFGVVGKTGAGTGEHFKINKEIDLYMGAFSKAFASQGAFVAGPRCIINYLKYHTRTQLHSKALPIVYAAGMIKRIQYLHQHPSLLKELEDKSKYMRQELLRRGFDLGQSDTFIIPIYVHCSIYEALNLVIDLREHYNLFCPVMIYPYIQKNQLLLRLMPTIHHSKEDIDFCVNAFVDIIHNLTQQKYTSDRSDFFQ